MSSFVCETCWDCAICNDCQEKLQQKQDEIKNLCIQGLRTDGGHHKQWFLEEILKAVGVDMSKVYIMDFERGIPP